MTASPESVSSSTGVKPRRVSTLSTVMALVAVLTISPSMRAGATSLGPVLTGVQSTFGVGAMAVGLLSALPCIVFALIGVLAVPLSKRFGLTCVVTAAMAVTTIGLGVRPFVSNYWAFLLLSIAGLAGPAVGNVIVPAWIKLHKAGRTVLLLTVYGSVLPLGGAAGSFLGAPIGGLIHPAGEPRCSSGHRGHCWQCSSGFSSGRLSVETLRHSLTLLGPYLSLLRC